VISAEAKFSYRIKGWKIFFKIRGSSTEGKDRIRKKREPSGRARGAGEKPCSWSKKSAEENGREALVAKPAGEKTNDGDNTEDFSDKSDRKNPSSNSLPIWLEGVSRARHQWAIQGREKTKGARRKGLAHIGGIKGKGPII